MSPPASQLAAYSAALHGRRCFKHKEAPTSPSLSISFFSSTSNLLELFLTFRAFSSFLRQSCALCFSLYTFTKFQLIVAGRRP
jgi:hypothetical protein